MREIKFRAWCKRTNRKFTNDDLLNVGRAVIEKMKVLHKGEPDVKNAKGGLFLPVDDENMIFEQYTGLKDKNGVEIYEGDIVHCWGGESCQGFHEYDTDITVDDEYQLRCFEIQEFEEYYIIGNVHDKAVK